MGRPNQGARQFNAFHREFLLRHPNDPGILFTEALQCVRGSRLGHHIMQLGIRRGPNSHRILQPAPPRERRSMHRVGIQRPEQIQRTIEKRPNTAPPDPIHQTQGGPPVCRSSAAYSFTVMAGHKDMDQKNENEETLEC